MTLAIYKYTVLIYEDILTGSKRTSKTSSRDKRHVCSQGYQVLVPVLPNLRRKKNLDDHIDKYTEEHNHCEDGSR
jgi:hypothetical protein